jgi:hypothetical protein
MEITLYELNVIVDTLIGSTSIIDGGTLFKYKLKLRQEVAEKLLKEMSNVNLDIKVKG